MRLFKASAATLWSNLFHLHGRGRKAWSASPCRHVIPLDPGRPDVNRFRPLRDCNTPKTTSRTSSLDQNMIKAPTLSSPPSMAPRCRTRSPTPGPRHSVIAYDRLIRDGVRSTMPPSTTSRSAAGETLVAVQERWRREAVERRSVRRIARRQQRLLFSVAPCRCCAAMMPRHRHQIRPDRHTDGRRSLGPGAQSRRIR